MTSLIFWILLILLILYLGIGLTIYYLGTRNKIPHGAVIHRLSSQRLAFKNEILNLVLRIKVPGKPKADVQSDPWHIVLVIDRSGSMSSLSGIYHAREAAWNLVATTPKDFAFSLVEFESFARVTCNFTTDKSILKSGLDKIECNGGTAIDEGLKIAFEQIKEEAPPLENTAIILMSDGGSDYQSAVRQAQILHDVKIPIFTVGFGHCDKDLLKEVAGDPLRFFYADEPSKLKFFFHMLGRKIRNNCAHDVEVIEYPNIAAAPLKLSGWGKLLPLEASGLFNRDNPMVKWFLTGLDLEASIIGYHLRPIKCGWYPVAHQEAQIFMKDQQDKKISFQSNLGPYVLVIPHFFMWQVLWVFLNPLYWMFKHQVLGEREPENQKISENNEYLPLTQLATKKPEIIPVPQQPFLIDMDPTLAIGIGYGGIQTLTHLKRFFWEHDQDELVNRNVAFSGLDTVNPYFSETIASGPIVLGPNEKKYICFQPPEESDKQRETPFGKRDCSWLDITSLNTEGIDYKAGAGAGNHPQVGRFIFLKNIEKINEFIPLIKQLHEAKPNRPFNLCIAATLGGGTSTGILLDLCYSLKKITQQLNIPQKSITLFLMDAEPDLEEPDRERKIEIYTRNKEALKRQLARFFASRSTPFSPAPGHEALHQWFDHILWTRKKQDYSNDIDLYPQTAALMYEWILESSFRDYIQTQSQYISTGLLVHQCRTEGLFLYKRLLEQFYAAKMVLKILVRSVLDFSPEVKDFSIENCTRNETSLSEVIAILLEKEEWAATRPQLLQEMQLMAKPNSVNLSLFLSRGGFNEINETSSFDEIATFIQRETKALGNLVFSWIEFIIATHQERKNEPLKVHKLPTAYFALQHINGIIERLQEFARNISIEESPADQKQCLVLIQMAEQFSRILSQWATVLKTWLDLLGEGTQAHTGLCRRLEEQQYKLEKMLKEAEALKTPHFQLRNDVRDEIYRRYFQQFETDILNAIYWLPDSGGGLKMGVSGFNQPEIYDHPLDDRRFEDLFLQLTALPGGFAAQQNQWHRFSIDDFLELNRLSGEEKEQKYLIPTLEEMTDETLCFMNRISHDRLNNEIPNGVSHYTVDSENPLARGFFQIRFNHEVFACGEDADFETFPPFVFNEEWNCYNALSIYRRLTRERIPTPPFSLVALCRDFKKFLGAIKYGIIDEMIKPITNNGKYLHGFGDLKKIPSTGDDEADILKLINIVIDSSDTEIIDVLKTSFRDLLKINNDVIERGIINNSILPFKESFKKHFYRLVYGGAEYYRHLKSHE